MKFIVMTCRYVLPMSISNVYMGISPHLALAVEGQEHRAVQASLVVPAAFFADKDEESCAIGIWIGVYYIYVLDGQHSYGLQADSYHELIDYPFEIAEQDKFDFIIQDNTQHQTLPHRFYLSGKHSANMGRLQQDVTQICQYYLDWLGDAPFDDYTFMTFASGQDYGGLEHINSTSLITPRRDLPSIDEPKLPSTDYQRFLGLCSHEYFHAWWVKTVRPDVMLDVDLRREAFTPLLWVFEGFTSYIDDFMLQASGVIDKPSYLRAIWLSKSTVTIKRLVARIKVLQSQALMRGLSYIVMMKIQVMRVSATTIKAHWWRLCLDLTLLQKSNGRYRLFDVVKAFYTQAKQNDNKRIGINSADMGTVIGQFMPIADWEDFEYRYVNGVEELPIEALLAANGISMHSNSKETADKHVPWGMRCTETPAGLKVNRVTRDSVAASAGISANDVIVCA